jgi:hypothetical protein
MTGEDFEGNPVSGADFQGGVLPEGIIKFADGQTASASIYFQFADQTQDPVPGYFGLIKDGIPEGVEAFIIELFDPATGQTIPTPFSREDVFFVHDVFSFGTRGTDSDDTLIGSEEGEILEGLGGNDVIEGMGGADTLDGGLGDDRLSGGPGDDILIGGFGEDTLDGGEDTDTADYTYYPRSLTVDLAAGAAGFPQEKDPTPEPLVSIENVRTGAGDDIVAGDGDANLLEGGAGNDRLDGRAGRDMLLGGSGHDRLDGGPGHDELWGGDGFDTFVFVADQGDDVVFDFQKGTDHIDLQGFRFQNRRLLPEDLDRNHNGVLDDGDNQVAVSPAADPMLNDIQLDLWSFAPAGRFGPLFPEADTMLKPGQPDFRGAPPSDGFSNRLTLHNVSGLLDADDFALGPPVWDIGPSPVVPPPPFVTPGFPLVQPGFPVGSPGFPLMSPPLFDLGELNSGSPQVAAPFQSDMQLAAFPATDGMPNEARTDPVPKDGLPEAPAAPPPEIFDNQLALHDRSGLLEAAQLVNSSRWVKDARQIPISLAMAARLNIDNGDLEPGYYAPNGNPNGHDLIAEAVEWLTRKAPFKYTDGSTGNTDFNSNGTLDLGIEFDTKGAGFVGGKTVASPQLTGTQDWQKYIDSGNPTSPQSGDISVTGRDLNNVLQALNIDQLVTSASGLWVGSNQNNAFSDFYRNTGDNLWAVLKDQQTIVGPTYMTGRSPS